MLTWVDVDGTCYTHKRQYLTFKGKGLSRRPVLLQLLKSTRNNSPVSRADDSALWVCPECDPIIKAACHYLPFSTALLFARSLCCVSAAVRMTSKFKVTLPPSLPFFFRSSSLPPSHLILSSARWVWLPSLWQFPAYCDRLVAPWSLRRAMAPWVSTETPLAMRLQD